MELAEKSMPFSLEGTMLFQPVFRANSQL